MKTRFANDNNVLWQYLELAASSIGGAVHHGTHINFRCNICGDGKSGRKKRGYLIYDKKIDRIYYKCFNYGDCDAAEHTVSGSMWLRLYYPHLYKQYRSHIFQDAKNASENLSNKVAVFRKKIVKKTDEQEAVKHFVPILKGSGELFDKAINICRSRRLLDDIWQEFFVATGGIYKGRLIVPFYHPDGSIYYYQARDLVGQTPKYLNRRSGRDSAIYGIYNIDKEKVVTVLEGPLDSIFAENAIATLGISFQSEAAKLLEGLNLRWLYDNDNAGNTAAIAKLKRGESVFRWDLFIKDYPMVKNAKDLNDVYIILNRNEKFSIEELSKYFTNHHLDLIYFN